MRDRETVMIRWKKIPSLWPCDGAWIMMMIMMMMARIQNVNKVQPKNGKKPASNYVTKKKIDFNFNFIFSSVVSIIIQIWFPWNLCAHDKATKKNQWKRKCLIIIQTIECVCVWKLYMDPLIFITNSIQVLHGRQWNAS